MITNQPSLAELLAAYKNNGVADAINAGVQGFKGGMDIAAGRQKAQLDQQNELAKQAVAGREVATKETDAATKAKEAQAKFIPVEIAEQRLQLAPGSLGQPGTQLPSSVFTDLVNRQSQQQNIQAQIAAQAQNKELAEKQIAAGQQLALQEKQMQAQTQAQGRADTNLTNATHLTESLPWYTNAAAAFGYHTRGYKTADQNLQHAMQQASAAPQSVLGNTPPPAQSATGPHGPTVKQNGVVYNWNPTTNQYE